MVYARYIGHAKKIGLLESETEVVGNYIDQSMCIKILSANQVRVHVYSILPKQNRGSNIIHPKALQHLMDKDIPGQLDRWLLCAAISGWDSAGREKGQLSLQEQGLLAALYGKLYELSNLE